MKKEEIIQTILLARNDGKLVLEMTWNQAEDIYTALLEAGVLKEEPIPFGDSPPLEYNSDFNFQPIKAPQVEPWDIADQKDGDIAIIKGKYHELKGEPDRLEILEKKVELIASKVSMGSGTWLDDKGRICGGTTYLNETEDWKGIK